jgi:hypothetical protein
MNKLLILLLCLGSSGSVFAQDLKFSDIHSERNQGKSTYDVSVRLVNQEGEICFYEHQTVCANSNNNKNPKTFVQSNCKTPYVVKAYVKSLYGPRVTGEEIVFVAYKNNTQVMSDTRLLWHFNMTKN